MIIDVNCSNQHHRSHYPDLGKGVEGYKKLVTLYHSVFPDAQIIIDDILADGDKLMVRWTSRGTHKGQPLDLAPTRKEITVTGIESIGSLVGKSRKLG